MALVKDCMKDFIQGMTFLALEQGLQEPVLIVERDNGLDSKSGMSKGEFVTEEQDVSQWMESF